MGILSQVLGLFQGIGTLVAAPPAVAAARIGLILLGMFLVYLGYKRTLEPLLMIPMGFGMIAVNAGVLYLDPATAGHVTGTAGNATTAGTLFVAPLVSKTESLMYLFQVDFLQPIYTLAFSNGLIACLVFMGIGVLLDVGFVIQRPLESMFLALCAELGTILTLPIAVMIGLSYNDAASIAMVGGADGPMVLFTSLMLSKSLFVPITVVAYIYLGLTYGGYPYLIRLLVPRRLRGITPKETPLPKVTPGRKLAFTTGACAILCLLFPVAAPLFLSLFVGIAVREAGLKHFVDLIGGPVLYGSTFMLGLLLGVLCEASLLLNPTVALLLILGIVSLLLSGIGGILGGYVLYFMKRGNYNPMIGIAGVSCVPTTAKVVQKEAAMATPGALILPQALGANICGVITTAIIAGIYTTIIPLLAK